MVWHRAFPRIFSVFINSCGECPGTYTRTRYQTNCASTPAPIFCRPYRSKQPTSHLHPRQSLTPQSTSNIAHCQSKATTPARAEAIQMPSHQTRVEAISRIPPSGQRYFQIVTKTRPNLRLSPGANQTHEDSAEQDQYTGNHAFLTPHDSPAMVAEEILGEQFDQGCENQETRRNGIHGPH